LKHFLGAIELSI